MHVTCESPEEHVVDECRRLPGTGRCTEARSRVVSQERSRACQHLLLTVLTDVGVNPAQQEAAMSGILSKLTTN